MLCLNIKGKKAIPQTKLTYRCPNNKQTNDLQRYYNSTHPTAFGLGDEDAGDI